MKSGKAQVPWGTPDTTLQVSDDTINQELLGLVMEEGGQPFKHGSIISIEGSLMAALWMRWVCGTRSKA